MKVITWQATHDGSNLHARVDLCQNHSNTSSVGMIPDPLPVPVSVSHGLHDGECEWCALSKVGK